MKRFIPLFAIAGLTFVVISSCNPFARISARPDPNTSTSGTVGSVKATNGALPIGERNAPRPSDTLVAKH